MERPFVPCIDEPRFACALYLDPYLELESDSCFVAELDGQIVGYLVGTRDARRFRLKQSLHAKTWLLKLLQIQVRGVVNRRFRHFLSHCVLAKIYWEMLCGRMHNSPDPKLVDMDRYPAGCHLQVAPEARRKCAGLALMLRFNQYLKAHGVGGLHGAVVEEVGNEDFSSMLQGIGFRVVHERQFTSRDVRRLIHPGVWKERVVVLDL